MAAYERVNNNGTSRNSTAECRISDEETHIETKTMYSKTNTGRTVMRRHSRRYITLNTVRQSNDEKSQNYGAQTNATRSCNSAHYNVAVAVAMSPLNLSGGLPSQFLLQNRVCRSNAKSYVKFNERENTLLSNATSLELISRSCELFNVSFQF